METFQDFLPARGIYTEEARKLRLAYLRERSGAKLNWIEGARLRADEVRGNIENFIGSIEIPVAVAGPMRMVFKDKVEWVYAPIATTEGALVASMTRGAKAVSAGAGMTARWLEQKISRAPLFELSDLDSAIAFVQWVMARKDRLQQEVRTLSRYSNLAEIEPVMMGRSVHLIFVFTTTDAAGQNMSTICTWKLCKWIQDELAHEFPSLKEKIKDFSLDGGLSSDKKVSFRNIIRGRGSRVMAECRISSKTLVDVLKVTPEYLVKMYHRGQSSAIHAGFAGYNINAANVVAGIYAATGQDIACVHESSTAQLHLEVEEGDLYASYLMPNLVAGSVGGGLSLTPQKEMLAIMGCEGEGKIQRFTEIITSFALALDLSTLSAIVGGQFATAHERLGRKGEGRWIKEGELQNHYVRAAVESRLEKGDAIASLTPIEGLSIGDSIVVESSTRISKKLCGFQAFSAKTTLGSEIKIFAKVTPSSDEVLLAGEMMASLSDPELGRFFKKYQLHSPFFQCDTRELHAYRLQDARFTSIAPKCFGVIEDHQRELYVVLQELLDDVELKDSVNSPKLWGAKHIQEAIRGIAGFHAMHYGIARKDPALAWIGDSPNLVTMLGIREFLGKLAEFGRREGTSWLTEDLFSAHQKVLETLPDWWAEAENLPHSLIHNDFNPRNIAFRKPSGRLVAYDWELVTRHLPQRDLVELLAFVLEAPSLSDILHWSEIHRRELEAQSGQTINEEEWKLGMELAAKDFLIHRLSLYFLVAPHREVAFLPRVYRATLRMISLLESDRLSRSSGTA